MKGSFSHSENFYWILIVLNAHRVAGSSLQTDDLSSECPSSVKNGFVPHPNDCGKLYYCLNGAAHLISCPFGLQWNQSGEKCEYNSTVKCQRSKDIALERNSLCPFEESLTDPFYFVPDGNDHQRIIKCVNGYAFILTCSSGDYWSMERNRCEQQNEQRTPSPTSVINLNCSEMDDLSRVELLPFWKNVGTPYKCLLDKTYIVVIINLTTSSTASPGVTSSSSTATSRTTLTTTINPNLPVPMPQCSDINSIVRFGIPGECKAYLQCHKGNAYKINCRNGREWSEASNDCIETHLAGCSGSPQTISSTSSPRRTSSTASSTASSIASSTAFSTNAPTTCTEDAQFLSYPNDCHKYVQCDNGKAILRECPYPLFWNKHLWICDWKCE